MHLSQLRLDNFRNYRHLELELPRRPCLFVGGNAQGKTNLMESIYLLATASSPHATSDAELISFWATSPGKSSSPDDPSPGEGPLARLWGRVERQGGPVTVDILWHRPSGSGIQKRIRVNDIPRRASDLVGQVLVVLFSPQDLALVDGPPQWRRRYLDGMNSLVDGHYRRAWQRYQQVLPRRNHLLRLIRDGQARPQELEFWDQQLVEAGSYLIWRRGQTTEALSPLVRELHLRLQGQESLELDYQPHLDCPDEPTIEGIQSRFLQALESARVKEIAQGMSLVGPHRDDLRFELGGVDAGVYASRGQQRTITVALKLAEAAFLAQQAGDPPIILLDDVLSELDAPRRRHLLEVAATYHQVLITATDQDRFEADLLRDAAAFEVKAGRVEPRPSP